MFNQVHSLRLRSCPSVPVSAMMGLLPSDGSQGREAELSVLTPSGAIWISVAVGTTIAGRTGWPGAVARSPAPTERSVRIARTTLVRSLFHSAAIACISEYERYSLGRTNGSRSLICWNCFHQTCPCQLRLLSILRQ
jgi:hypothetical protein